MVHLWSDATNILGTNLLSSTRLALAHVNTSIIKNSNSAHSSEPHARCQIRNKRILNGLSVSMHGSTLQAAEDADVGMTLNVSDSNLAREGKE